MLITILIILLVLLIFVIAVILVRASAFLHPPEPVAPVKLPEVDPDLIASHLAEAVRCQTISHLEGETPDLAAFRELRRVLEAQYPRVHATLEREIISDASLLYTWRGSNLDLPPVMFCAHLDVVPADPATLDQWEHPPFAGIIADDYVWGRGTFDIKCQAIGLLEAAELLLKQNFKPERTIYFAFGQDEEIGGEKGAAQIAAYLSGRGERLEAVLDEGGIITQGILPGIDAPVGLIGITEKGYLSLKIKSSARPGHSSMPEKTTAIGILARAITRLEDNPLPPRLDFVRMIYSAMGGAVSPAIQIAFANTWLFGGYLKRRLEGDSNTSAAMRTTTAVTMINGGIKDNLLPASAEALVNFRLLPGDTIEDLVEYCGLVIRDPNVSVKVIPQAAWEATPLTSPQESAFSSLAEAVRQVYPGAEAAPYLVLGTTDSRHYAALSDQVLRFTPLLATSDDLSRMHGVNERVHVGALARMVQFYVHLFNAWAGGELPAAAKNPPEN